MTGLELKNISFTYPKAKKPTLDGVNVLFEAGTVSAIQGYSGAGKSTLLYLLAGMDKPTQGQMLYNGRDVAAASLTAYRRETVSLIAQSYLLFPGRTALENVCYPMQLSKVANAEEKARAYLNAVHIEAMLHDRLPEKLSGGEQQRVAIARCLAASTPVIAADEPTGNLDEENAHEVMDILLHLAHNEGKTIVLVTHDRSVAELADKRYTLSHGVLKPMA